MISISIVHHVFSFTMRFFVITTFNLNLYPHLFKLKGVTKNFHSEEKNPEDACGRKKNHFCSPIKKKEFEECNSISYHNNNVSVHCSLSIAHCFVNVVDHNNNNNIELQPLPIISFI